MWYHILRFILINRKKEKNPTPISSHLALQNQNNTRLAPTANISSHQDAEVSASQPGGNTRYVPATVTTSPLEPPRHLGCDVVSRVVHTNRRFGKITTFTYRLTDM